MTFGYATSILYHRLSEKDDRYRFVTFPASDRRAPIQTEYAAISENCRECELAKEFMTFLVSSEAQVIVMNKNWMLPVRREAARGTPFEDLFHSSADLIPGMTHSKSSSEPAIDPDLLLERWSEAGR